MATPIIQVKDLCVSFQGDDSISEVLHHVSFELYEGDILGVVGESGSGKSVTSLAIMGLLPKPAGTITSGSIKFNGNELLIQGSEHYYKLRGNRISMIFQDPVSALNPVMRIGDQLAEIFRIHNPEKTAEGIRSESIQLLNQVGIANPVQRLEEYPHLLSGGICQRIMIAMALVCRPDVLIADEPSTALDVTTQKQILNLLKELQSEFGMSIIFITHDLGVVAQICNRVIVMEKGYVRESNTVRGVFEKPCHPYTKTLLNSIIHMDMLPSYRTDNGKLASFPQKKTPLLVVSNVSKKYPIRAGVFSLIKGWSTVVNNANFDLFEGEVLGLVGESGCGKSTLGRMILQLDSKSSGDIIYNSVNLSNINKIEMRKLRREIQVVFQDGNESLNPRHTVGTILEEPYIIHKIGTALERKKWVKELLDKVGLPQDSLNRFPHEFSGGQRQRIGIARAIALKPKLIICDEPVSALDVSTRGQILSLLYDLKSDLDLSLLFISHDLSVVNQVSDRVMVMRNGEIIELNSTEQIFSNPQHEYTKLLIDSIPRAPQ